MPGVEQAARPLVELIRPALRVPRPGQRDSILADNPVVHVAGDTGLLERAGIAIIGSRRVSAHGAARAARLARELSQAGIVVVSGLAEGVDTAALRSAIDSAGAVIGVIGTPLDIAYPARNRGLQDTVARDHLLMSPFATGAAVRPKNFPFRNRVMAAICDGSAIIEAAHGSGTRHQADECVRLGRWLFVAGNVVDDAALTWPRLYATYDRFVVLRDVADILSRLEAS